MKSPRMFLRWLPWAALVALVIVALVMARDGGSSEDGTGGRVEQLTERLRCPTCQGLSVADSPSSTARAITEDVRRRVDGGQADGQILQAYVDRYGEWILLSPRSAGAGVVVWALPVAAVVIAAGALALAFRRWRREPTTPATDADRALVARERGSGER
jgi:cytochrome c-type biogenesis protein CcmH